LRTLSDGIKARSTSRYKRVLFSSSLRSGISLPDTDGLLHPMKRERRAITRRI